MRKRSNLSIQNPNPKLPLQKASPNQRKWRIIGAMHRTLGQEMSFPLKAPPKNGGGSAYAAHKAAYEAGYKGK